MNDELEFFILNEIRLHNLNKIPIDFQILYENYNYPETEIAEILNNLIEMKAIKIKYELIHYNNKINCKWKYCLYISDNYIKFVDDLIKTHKQKYL